MRQGLRFLIVFAIGIGLGAVATAEDADPERQYKIYTEVYRVLTNVTGNGLTSQTLPGVAGSYQIVHEKLDDVELVMEGETLTWDGEPKPNHPRIELLTAPTLVASEGVEAKIYVGQEAAVQYFEQSEDGRFELRTWTPERENILGIQLSLDPRRADRPGVVNVDFSFKLTWIRDREPIEGVGLNVGKPILGVVSAENTLTTRLNEWVCYQPRIPSGGHLYLFMRIAEVGDEASGRAITDTTTRGHSPDRDGDGKVDAPDGQGHSN